MKHLYLIAIVAAAALVLSAVACKSKATPPAESAEEEKPAETAAVGESIPGIAEKEKEDDAFKAPGDVAAPPADAEKTESGLASNVLQAGKGSEHPGPIDGVTCHYTGWTTDGKLFDSSVKRGQPATFPLNRVIPGWTEGMQLMVAGEKRRFWIPVELAYNGAPGKPPGMLVFDVELQGIIKAPEAPEDVAKPPKKVKKTDSGLAYMVLEKGEGTEHPAAASMVTVHYTGWTTDGKLFDSSITRDKPATFPMGKVIPGWTEGLQLMVKGEKRRFWIPVELAYNGAPGKPAGMLVFDVELIDFK